MNSAFHQDELVRWLRQLSFSVLKRKWWITGKWVDKFPISLFALPLRVLMAQSRWDNKRCFLPAIGTAVAIYSTLTWPDVAGWSWDSPEGRNTCRDSCVQNKPCHCRAETRRWTSTWTNRYCRCRRHRNRQSALDDSFSYYRCYYRHYESRKYSRRTASTQCCCSWHLSLST